jgi:glycerol-3-phosphate acyltransferase PlsX
MGGDHAPEAPVQGALMAVEANRQIQVTLVGDERIIQQHLGPNQGHPQITIHPASEVIGMEDEPVAAVRKKRHSSMVEAMKDLKGGAVDAVISAGNTGALMASGLFYLGRMGGVERPALTAMVPSVKTWGVLLLDVGANLDPKPEHLVQYALLGALYCQEALDIAKPKVGLLNVGTEPQKGPKAVREAFRLLTQLSGIDFIGNVEARELLQGKADVVVSVGFVGNVALKVTEGVARDLFHEIRSTFDASWLTRVAGLIVRPRLRKLVRAMDYETTGGAPLLGLDGVVYKCHGSSEARSFQSALLLAESYLAREAHSRIRERLAEARLMLGGGDL